MPVTADYTYSETTSHIEVVIPLKGVTPKKVDIFTASTILKVSFPPFLLDLDLSYPIDVEKSKAVLKDGTLKIRLSKKHDQQQLWGHLCFEGTKGEIKQRRQLAFKEREEKIKNQMEKVASKKLEEERMVFRQHMHLEQKERRRMDDVKDAEKKHAEEAMYKTFSEIQSHKAATVAMAEEKDNTKIAEQPQDDEPLNTMVELMDNSNDDLPPPRQVAHATFRHTPRLFKTPSRESTVEQEQEFIVKNRANLSKNILLNANTNISDVDPVWLNKKGDEFYNRGDHSSAINAYSEALEADETMVTALASRAACFLQLREATSCIKDCLDVLAKTGGLKSQFLTEEAKHHLLKETNVRLGMAYCLNKEYVVGMKHFQLANEISLDDSTTTECIDYLKILMEATKWKEDGDGCVADEDFSKAKESYSKALSSDSLLVSAMINRAAVHLALNDNTACIQDCSDALESLSRRDKSKSNILATVLSPTGRVRRKWIATLLCRRAAAKRNEGDLEGSLADLEDTLRSIRREDDFDFDIEALKTDIAKLKDEVSKV